MAAVDRKRGEAIVVDLVREYAVARRGLAAETVVVVCAEHEAVAAYRAGATVSAAAEVAFTLLDAAASPAR